MIFDNFWGFLRHFWHFWGFENSKKKVSKIIRTANNSQKSSKILKKDPEMVPPNGKNPQKSLEWQIILRNPPNDHSVAKLLDSTWFDRCPILCMTQLTSLVVTSRNRQRCQATSSLSIISTLRGWIRFLKVLLINGAIDHLTRFRNEKVAAKQHIFLQRRWGCTGRDWRPTRDWRWSTTPRSGTSASNRGRSMARRAHPKMADTMTKMAATTKYVLLFNSNDYRSWLSLNNTFIWQPSMIITRGSWSAKLELSVGIGN